MSQITGLHWKRIIPAIIAAEVMPILLLIVVVGVYGFVRQSDSMSPEEFAPLAGNWVGPIGGFLATLLMAWWAARRALDSRIAHGAAVGIGTAVLDFSLGILLSGGAISIVFFFSNAGRIVAGLLGGWISTQSGKGGTTSEE